MDLFGGSKPWSALDWTSSDDRVRGGASQSYLECSPPSSIATFRGTLDIKTLGGAGFASQRTTADHTWDLSAYDGILLDLGKSDRKMYTFILKDELLPKSPDGREQSTISWEFDFEGPADHSSIFIKWTDLKPTYRGREKKDAVPLDLNHIKRFSIMMRSFFGTQEGDFSLDIISISAVEDKENIDTPYRDDPSEKGYTNLDSRKGEETPTTRQSWIAWFFGCNVS
ncbi:uncharacterized protein EAF01_006028 [Botrytis porri]|uniref:NADH:ubiquinone oxidoreductase intermediate-associated protein 30 domain-containing protein n=1 Tax=Botrytis porri TaxID=87229 RepID=A0A4Z1KIS8_9HELO|nr:uncharacterized protein EAF01_006028 [Botrytis porri]KAF7905507.1 hypothetical protein EAF01_006028 [Botrytis porri]TGO85973.1 hypothetical protein BPOR_0347g00050 [Botrytis porri]